MYLPKMLYESLPIIYILLGVMGIIAPERYGMFCGIALIIIAFVIYGCDTITAWMNG